MKCLVHVPRSAVLCLALLVWPPTTTGCASSPAGLEVDAGSDAAVVTSPTRSDAARLEGDAGTASCGTTLNGEGCPCSPGAAPRSCYVGVASQAGVGACVFGQQSCSSQGESGGAWGECSGSGVPTAACTANMCGSVSDGCGGVLDCGQCPSGQACGGGGAANQCGTGVCTPTTTCASLGFACGMAADKCGNTLDCGTCAGGQACGGSGLVNQCGCTPATCAEKGDACGSDSDGCGGTLDCGGCPSGQTCGGDGTPNQCGSGAPQKSCGPLQNCYWTSDYLSNAHPVKSAATATECQAYCDSFTDTVCCLWEVLTAATYQGISTPCWAFFDSACASPENWQDVGCSDGSPADTLFWGSICQ